MSVRGAQEKAVRKEHYLPPAPASSIKPAAPNSSLRRAQQILNQDLDEAKRLRSVRVQAICNDVREKQRMELKQRRKDAHESEKTQEQMFEAERVRKVAHEQQLYQTRVK